MCRSLTRPLWNNLQSVWFVITGSIITSPQAKGPPGRVVQWSAHTQTPLVLPKPQTQTLPSWFHVVMALHSTTEILAYMCSTVLQSTAYTLNQWLFYSVISLIAGAGNQGIQTGVVCLNATLNNPRGKLMLPLPMTFGFAGLEFLVPGSWGGDAAIGTLWRVH